MKRKGKILILRADHGIHGVNMFTKDTIQPEKQFDLALEGGYTSILCNQGLVEKYHVGPFKDVAPIVQMMADEQQICTVNRAARVGAHAVAMHITKKQLGLASSIIDEAHQHAMQVILQVPSNTYDAARLALELGADYIIVQEESIAKLKWIIQCAGRTQVLLEPAMAAPEGLAAAAEAVNETGAAGLVLGRQVWAAKKPFALSKAIEEILFHKMPAKDSLEMLNK